MTLNKINKQSQHWFYKVKLFHKEIKKYKLTHNPSRKDYSRKIFIQGLIFLILHTPKKKYKKKIFKLLIHINIAMIMRKIIKIHLHYKI
jgi:hypothetical protein